MASNLKLNLRVKLLIERETPAPTVICSSKSCGVASRRMLAMTETVFIRVYLW
jgi:hypothetical protein